MSGSMVNIRKGVLIRIKDDTAYGNDTTRHHGRLWVVEQAAAVVGTIYAKSLATGYRYLWFRSEYDVA